MAPPRPRHSRIVDSVSSVVLQRVDRVAARFDSAKGWWMGKPYLRHTLPQAALIALIILYFLIFERLVWARHVNFNTFDYDLGYNSQAAWLLAHGRGFNSIRGMQVLGHHVSPGFYLFAPVYWLGGGAQFLDVVNTAAVTLGAVPLFFIGRHRLKSDWFGLGLAAAYLFHYMPQWLIQETFHPENLAIAALFAAFYFAMTRSWRWYWVAVVFALLWKEDVALVVTMLGIFTFFFFKCRRVGAVTFGLGLVWFVIATKVVEPYFSPAGAVYDSLFGPLGSSATEAVINSVRHPEIVARTLASHGAENGALKLIRGYGFVPFGGAVVFILGVPQHVINFLTAQSFTYDPLTHYFAMPFVAVTLAATWVLGNRRRSSVAWVLLFVMLLGVFATKNEGVGPWTVNSHKGYWTQNGQPWKHDADEALKLIPADVAVAAYYGFVPHISERPLIYTYPNPWSPSNYGPGGAGLTADPSTVQYVMLLTSSLNADDRTQYEKLRASGEFEVVYDHPPIVLMHRISG